MSGKGYAKCVFNKINGVNGFNMIINDNDYGHYPIGNDEATFQINVEEQMRMAINDAKDYDYDGICFS